ncbi:MAG: cytochrome c biogenesis protein [Candidatus Limnocylindria bacterium]
MLQIAALLVSAALAALLVATAAGGAAVLTGAAAVPTPPRTDRQGMLWRVASVARYAGLAAVLAALATRAAGVGHAPWSNLYEVSQAFAAAILLAYIVVRRSFPVDALAPAVSGLAALLLVHAVSLPSDALPLVPALQQPALLTVHVAAAVAAYGIYGVALVAALAELVQRGRRAVRWLPDTAVCRAVAHRSVVLGYPILTAAIVLGAIWANLAWRSYWNNDPKELTAAATWLTYGAYLHVAGRRDRWGRTAPWLIVAGFAGIMLTYFGANLLFPGQHSYAGI